MNIERWTSVIGHSAAVRALTVILILTTGFVSILRSQETSRLRWEYFYQRRAFPFDHIPAGALQAAREELRRPDLLRSPLPVAGNSWTPIGPEGIPISITSIGRLTAIAVHPTNSNTIYVGGAQGGVWKTTDGGSSWTPLTDNECSLAMGAIAIDPIQQRFLDLSGNADGKFNLGDFVGYLQRQPPTPKREGER